MYRLISTLTDKLFLSLFCIQGRNSLNQLNWLNRLKREKEKKEGKKEFKEVLKSRDLDNVFEIQVGGKMRIF